MLKLAIQRLSIIFCVITFSLGCDAENYKYSQSDCITPININYSWYDKYALVDGFVEGNYILAFPHSGSRNAVFEKEIEAQTRQVSLEKCI